MKPAVLALALGGAVSHANFTSVDTMMHSFFNLKVEEIIAERGPLRTAIPYPSVNYGCFCRYIAQEEGIFKPNEEPTGKALGYLTLDSIDALCKRLMNGWACLAASGCDLSTQDYKTPGFFGFDSKCWTPGECTSTEMYQSSCDTANPTDQFAADLCKVEMTFAADFMSEFFLNPTQLSYQEDPDYDPFLCNPVHPQPGTQKWMRCCDTVEYPDRQVFSIPADGTNTCPT